MQIFISWSGTTSKTVAIALREWLPNIIQSLRPWMSAVDIGAGDRWTQELIQALDACNFGILVVTKENVNEPWLLFEAGALSKKIAEKTRVVPYVVDLKFEELSSPLKTFQGKEASREATLQMLNQINDLLDSPLLSQRLEDTFNAFWPTLEKAILDVRTKGAPVEPETDSKEMLKEILAEVRAIKRRQGELESMSGRSRSIGSISQFTKEDLIEAFAKVPDFGPEAVEAQIEECMRWLTQNSIRTSEQLFGLVEDKKSLERVRELYRQELLRTGDKPLDPLAVATWVAALHYNKDREETEQQIIEQLRRSPEYRQRRGIMIGTFTITADQFNEFKRLPDNPITLAVLTEARRVVSTGGRVMVLPCPNHGTTTERTFRTLAEIDTLEAEIRHR